jgi:hypothetical protein
MRIIILLLVVCININLANAKPKKQNKTKLVQTTDTLHQKLADSLSVVKDLDTTLTKEVKEVKEIQKEKKVEYYTGQCQATTKKGRQCSRSADGGNKYCWQHD